MTDFKIVLLKEMLKKFDFHKGDHRGLMKLVESCGERGWDVFWSRLGEELKDDQRVLRGVDRRADSKVL